MAQLTLKSIYSDLFGNSQQREDKIKIFLSICETSTIYKKLFLYFFISLTKSTKKNENKNARNFWDRIPHAQSLTRTNVSYILYVPYST